VFFSAILVVSFNNCIVAVVVVVVVSIILVQRKVQGRSVSCYLYCYV